MQELFKLGSLVHIASQDMSRALEALKNLVGLCKHHCPVWAAVPSGKQAPGVFPGSFSSFTGAVPASSQGGVCFYVMCEKLSVNLEPRCGVP